MSQALAIAETRVPDNRAASPELLALEDQEHALQEITEQLARKMVASDIARQEVDRLYARWCVVRGNVVEARRRAGRINCQLSDGSRIYDIEEVNRG